MKKKTIKTQFDGLKNTRVVSNSLIGSDMFFSSNRWAPLDGAASLDPNIIVREIKPQVGNLFGAVTSTLGGGNGITGSQAGVTTFDIASDLPSTSLEARDLMSDTKWGSNALSQPVSLTYSFYKSGSATNYNLSPNSVATVSGTSGDVSMFSELNVAQKATAYSALATFAAVSNATFSEVADSSTSAGDIRWFNTSNTSAVSTAASVGASSQAYAGDIWFGGGGCDRLQRLS